MCEQLTFENQPTSLKEEIQKIITDICYKQDVNSKYVSCTETKTGISVWILEPISMKANLRIFNLKKTAKQYEVSILSKRVGNIKLPQNIEITDNPKSKQSVLKFSLDTQSLIPFLYSLIDYEVKNFTPSDGFHCCGKYNECSDAKKCVHREDFYARGCSYRKNLEVGRIFYGQNRNVD